MKNKAGYAAGALSLVLMAAATAALCTAASAQPAGRNVWDGVYTTEQATRGQVAYAAQCAICHAATLSGGDVTPPLAGPTFLGAWTSTNALELFNRIHETMPIADPGSLSRAQTADVVAYIFQTNGFPAGDTAMPPVDPALANIVITSSKPGP